MTSTNAEPTVNPIIDRAWNRGDLTAIDEFVHADYVRHTSTGDVIGPEGFKQRILMMRAAFPDLHSTIEDVITEGDRSAARFTVRGTHLGEFFGIPPTSRPVEFVNAVIVHQQDGMLYEEWEFLDTAAFLRQLTD